MSCTQLLVLLFSGAQADPGFQCTVSSLQKNCQAADFVRCDCVFTCPGTLLIRCLVCAVTRVRPLQVAVRLCPSLCGTAERTAGQHLHLKPRVSRSKRESSGDVAGTTKKYRAITIETKVKIIERVERDEKVGGVACAYNTELLAGHQEELTNEELMNWRPGERMKRDTRKRK